MSESQAYRQCELTLGYDRKQVAWIPVKLAVAGKTLMIRTKAGVWIDGWVVTKVYDHEYVDLHSTQERFKKVLR